MRNRLLKTIKIKSIILLFCIFFYTSGANAFSVKKRVLVLHSYHIGLSWTEKIISGIESVFKKARKNGLKIKIDFEYMDTKRFVDKAYYKLLYKLYKHKAEKLKYDVIISADDNALNFLLKYRNKIYGIVPVVFCGVNFYNKSRLKNHKLYTGVVEAFDAKATINLALKLHPDTKKIVIVGDGTTSGLNNKKSVEKIIPAFKNKKIKFVFFNDGDIMQYQTKLGLLKKGSIVLAMLFNRDSDNKFYTYEESFKIYSKYIRVPIYTLWDFYLNAGSIGGKIISGFTQGKEAAKKTIQILEGHKVSNIPVLEKSPNQTIFDYKYLKAFSVNLSDLPGDSIILNKPNRIIDFVKKNIELILIILAIIVFLITVIIILSINIIKRKKLELKLLATNKAYDRFVPHAFLDNLKINSITDVKLGDQIQKTMTILFSDIRSFTTLSEKMTPKENFDFLNSYLSIVSPIIRNNEGFIDKYIGDAIMALFPRSAEDALICAITMLRRVIDYNIEGAKKGKAAIEIGIGLHIGVLMMGTVGEDLRMEGTVISDAVNLGSRLEGLTKIFGAKIIISESTLNALGENCVKYMYRFLGKVSVKGKEKPVSIYEVIDGNEHSLAELKIKTKKLFESGLELYYKKEFLAAKLKFQKVADYFPEDKAAGFYLKKSDQYAKNKTPDDWGGFDKLTVK